MSHLPALERLAETWPPLVPRPLVYRALGFSDTTARNYERAGRLPRPIYLSPRRACYERDALLAALAKFGQEAAAP